MSEDTWLREHKGKGTQGSNDTWFQGNRAQGTLWSEDKLIRGHIDLVTYRSGDESVASHQYLENTWLMDTFVMLHWSLDTSIQGWNLMGFSERKTHLRRVAWIRSHISPA